MEAKYDAKITGVQSKRGGEFISNNFERFLSEKGVQHKRESSGVCVLKGNIWEIVLGGLAVSYTHKSQEPTSSQWPLVKVSFDIIKDVAA